MPITKENAKAAIRRFFCPIDQGYPSLTQMCFVETFEGKEGKETAELYGFTRDSIGKWISEGKNKGRVNNPATGLDFKEIAPSLISGEEIFSLVLAIVQASGHLPAVIEEDEEFADFSKTRDYQKALEHGKTLLNFVVNFGEGVDLQAKIQSLSVRNLNGGAAQIRLLEETLKFKLSDFANYNEMGNELPDDLPPPIEAKVDVLIPPQAMMRFAPMLDPFSPFAPVIGAVPNAVAYDEQGEIKRVMEASMQDNEGADMVRAMAASLHVQQDEDFEVALAMQVSLQAQALNEDAEVDLAMQVSSQVQASFEGEVLELALALTASVEELKVPEENALAMRLNQAQQAYGDREVKAHIETNEQFLARLDAGIQTNIGSNAITLLRKMLERIELKLGEAVFQENNENFVEDLHECQTRINAYINEGRVIPASVRQPTMRLP